MKKVLFLALIIVINASAQQISWQKYFGSQSTYNQYCNSIIENSDSSFIFSAALMQYSLNKVIVKCDKLGDTIWSKHYEVWGGNLIRTLDGGYACSGGGSNSYFKLLKLDNNGDSVWCQSYQTIPYAGVVTQCRDSGYVLAGANWIIKTNSLGNVVWQKNLAGSYESVIECFNGDILAVGMFGYYKYIATLLDSSGTIQWQKLYCDFSSGGGGGQFYLHGAVQLPDSNFLVVANNDKNPFYANSGGFDLAKINITTGDTIWTKQFPTFYAYTYIAAISNIKDNYAFMSLDEQLFKIDFNGNIIWSLPTYDVIHSVTTCSDGGAAFAGAKLIGGPQTQYLATYAKTDSLGNIFNFQSVPELTANELRVYPNPAFNQLTASPPTPLQGRGEVTVTIYDMLGKMQLQQKLIPQGDFKMDVNDLPSGLYLIQLKQADRLFNGRFVKE